VKGLGGWPGSSRLVVGRQYHKVGGIGNERLLGLSVVMRHERHDSGTSCPLFPFFYLQHMCEKWANYNCAIFTKAHILPSAHDATSGLAHILTLNLLFHRSPEILEGWSLLLPVKTCNKEKVETELKVVPIWVKCEDNNVRQDASCNFCHLIVWTSDTQSHDSCHEARVNDSYGTKHAHW